ncbi:MAG: hypothetical protein ACW98D_08135 [Promethearchaeota archaeon]|jgi:hypothetical protein
MVEDEKDFRWTVKLDWFNIVIMLKLDNINQIPEVKKGKAIRRLTRVHGPDKLMAFEPDHLENLVINELKELMKKELLMQEKKQKELERDIRNKVIPLKRGGIIKLDPRDLKDFKGDPEDMLKYLYKKFLGDDKDEDKDDDKDKYQEDRNHYYI